MVDVRRKVLTVAEFQQALEKFGFQLAPEEIQLAFHSLARFCCCFGRIWVRPSRVLCSSSQVCGEPLWTLKVANKRLKILGALNEKTEQETPSPPPSHLGHVELRRRQDVLKIMRHFDTRKDGQVSYNEFCDAL